MRRGRMGSGAGCRCRGCFHRSQFPKRHALLSNVVAHQQFPFESPFPVAKCQPRGYDRSQGDEDYDADGDVLLHGAVAFLTVRFMCECNGYEELPTFLHLACRIVPGLEAPAGADAGSCSANVKMVQGP